MTPTITVTVAGPQGAGKTTIANAIAAVLGSHGIHTDGARPWLGAVEALSELPEVEIEIREEQT